MRKINYILKRIFTINYRLLFKNIAIIKEKTNKSLLFIVTDILRCAFKYGAGYMDYRLFEMYKLNEDERNTYLTRKRNEEIFKKYDDLNYVEPFANKAVFLERFKKYLNRDFEIITKDNIDNVRTYILNHESFMLKEAHGTGGLQVSKIKRENIENIDDFINNLLNSNDLYIVEDVIEQHEIMNKLCPDSINTLRVVTLLTTSLNKPYKDLNKEEKNIAEVKVNIFAVILRVGKGDVCVDNFHSGGLATPVDIESGKVLYPAINRNDDLFEYHPKTNIKFVDFEIPMFNNAIEMCKNAALEVKEMGYVGWDVAISKNVPVLVEANDIPGYDLYQLPGQCANHIGMYKKYLDIENDNKMV